MSRLDIWIHVVGGLAVVSGTLVLLGLFLRLMGYPSC